MIASARICPSSFATAVLVAALAVAPAARTAGAASAPPSLAVFTPARMAIMHVTFAAPDQPPAIDQPTAIQKLEQYEPGAKVLQVVLADATGVREFSDAPVLCYAIAVQPGQAPSSGMSRQPVYPHYQVEFIDAVTGAYLGYLGGA